MKKNLKMIIPGTIALSVIILMAFSTKTEEPTVLVKTTLPIWEMAKMHTLEVLDAMPEDKFSYKPTAVSKSFGSQLVHIGYSLKYFKHGMIEGNRIPYEEPDASTMSKEEIRKMVEEGFDLYIAAIKKLSEEDLNFEMPFGPEKKITRGQAIIFAHDHVTNHRAKANLYLRMNDIDPPNYKFI